jgi:serine/threonine protein kinase
MAFYCPHRYPKLDEEPPLQPCTSKPYKCSEDVKTCKNGVRGIKVDQFLIADGQTTPVQSKTQTQISISEAKIYEEFDIEFVYDDAFKNSASLSVIAEAKHVKTGNSVIMKAFLRKSKKGINAIYDSCWNAVTIGLLYEKHAYMSEQLRYLSSNIPHFVNGVVQYVIANVSQLKANEVDTRSYRKFHAIVTQLFAIWGRYHLKIAKDLRENGNDHLTEAQDTYAQRVVEKDKDLLEVHFIVSTAIHGVPKPGLNYFLTEEGRENSIRRLSEKGKVLGYQLTPQRAYASLLFQLVFAVHALYTSGIQHSDLHSGNILVDIFPESNVSYYTVENTVFKVETPFKIYIFDYDGALFSSLGNNLKWCPHGCPNREAKYDLFNILSIIKDDLFDALYSFRSEVSLFTSFYVQLAPSATYKTLKSRGHLQLSDFANDGPVDVASATDLLLNSQLFRSYFYYKKIDKQAVIHSTKQTKKN